MNSNFLIKSTVLVSLLFGSNTLYAACACPAGATEVTATGDITLEAGKDYCISSNLNIIGSITLEKGTTLTVNDGVDLSMTGSLLQQRSPSELNICEGATVLIAGAYTQTGNSGADYNAATPNISKLQMDESAGLEVCGTWTATPTSAYPTTTPITTLTGTDSTKSPFIISRSSLSAYAEIGNVNGVVNLVTMSSSTVKTTSAANSCYAPSVAGDDVSTKTDCSWVASQKVYIGSTDCGAIKDYPFVKVVSATDLDGDGIDNILDIDDDNDGILDAIESPSCFYTKAESKNKVSVRSDLLPYSASYPISLTINEKTDYAFYFKNGQDISAKTLFEWETATPATLESVHFLHASRYYSIYYGGSATLQAWNGTAWVDLAASSNDKEIRSVIAVTKNQGSYKKYRLFGVSGSTYSSGGVTEIVLSSVEGAAYVASLYPKPICTEDIDGDGKMNHQDLNSDADTCSDGVEGGNTLVSNNNFSTYSSGADANNNGLLDSFEDGTSGNINYILDDKGFAYNKKVDACMDSDSDGVLDLVDLDDDNDGILDSIECARTELYAKDGHFAKPLTEVESYKSYSQKIGDTTVYYKALKGSIYPITEAATSNPDQLYASGTTISYTYPVYRSTMEITFSTNLTTRWAITDIDQPTENIDVEVYDVHNNIIPNPEDFIVMDSVGGSDGTFPAYVDLNYTDMSTNAVLFPSNTGKLHIEDGPGGVTYGFARKSMIFFDFGGKAISRIVVSNNSSSAAPGFIFSSIKPTNDTDGDGLVDCIDPDSDGDGCMDAKEAHPSMTNFAAKPVVDANGLVVAFGVSGNSYTQAVPTLSNGKYAYQESIKIDVTTNPVDVSNVLVGSSATFTAKATATQGKTSPATTASTNLNYQWEVSIDGGTTYSNIAGASGVVASGDTVNYTKSGVTFADNNKRYRVNFSNEAHVCSKTSDPATLSVVKPPQPPVANDDNKTGISGQPVTLTPSSNDSDPENDLDTTTIVLTKSPVAGSTITPDGKSATIPNEGTWKVNGNGSVTFTPNVGFTKDPTPIEYKISDKTSLVSNEAKLTIDYPQTAPVAKDDKKSGIPTKPVTIDPFVENGSGIDSDPENDLDRSTLVLTTTTAPNATVAGDGKSITVPNEGVWSVSSTGDVTFTPEAGFLSDPTPVNYKVFDKTGLVSNEAKLTIDYADVYKIAGKVEIQLNGSKVTPLVPVNVTLKDASGNEVATTTTDANGHYEFLNIVAGNYTVVETNPTGTVSVSDKDGNGNTFDVIAVALTTADLVDNDFVDKPEAGNIEGTVYKDSDTNGDYDGTDQALPNVEVIVTDAYGKKHKVITDSNGRYSVLNIPAGATTVATVSDDPDLPEGAISKEHGTPVPVTVEVGKTAVYNMGYIVSEPLDIDPATVATCANPTSITWAGSTKSSQTTWSGESDLKAKKVVTTVGGKTVTATFKIDDNSSKFNYVDANGKNAGTNAEDGSSSVFPQPYMSLYLGNQTDNTTTDLKAGDYATLSVTFSESVILDNWRIRDIDSGDQRGTETGWAWQDAVQMKGFDKEGNEVALTVALSDGTNLEQLEDGFVQTKEAETGIGMDASKSEGHAVWSSNGAPVAKLVLVHKAGSDVPKQTRAAIALSGFAVCTPITISGTIYDDANGSKEGVNGTPLGQIEGNPLYAHLVDVAGNVVDVVEVNATTGAYLFDNAIATNSNYTVQISSTKTEASNPMPTVTLPANWSNVSEDAVLDGSRVVAVVTESVENVNFGLDKAPENADIVASKAVNPGGTKVAPLSTTPITAELLNSLGIKDLEDGTPKTMVIETIPTTGKIYYNNVAIKVGDVIENIDYTKVTIDPDEGNVTVFFNFHMVDEANVTSPSATFSKPFYFVAPKAENDSAVNPNPIDPSNPTTVEVIGSDTNGTYPFDPSSVNLIDPLGTPVKTLIVEGEGVWSVDGDGSIVFTPEAGFYGDPTDVNYTLTDTEGNEVQAEVKVDYPDRLPPVAVDDNATGVSGTPTTLTPVTNDTDPENDVNATTLILTNSPVVGAEIDPSGKSATIPNEGIWSVDGNGDVTFTPNVEFKGDPTPINYKIFDNSKLPSNEAKITIDYPQTAPVAKDDKKRGTLGNPVTLTPVVDNGAGKDSDPEDNLDPTTLVLTSPSATENGKKLTVPNEGTWSVLPNGNVTFTPNKEFTADPTPVNYKVFDKTNLPSNEAKITIDYPAVSSDDKKTGTRGDPVTIPVTDNDGINDDINKSTIMFIDPELKTKVPKLVVPNEGTWSVDGSGNIIFTPNEDFTGDPTPIEYVSIDNNGNNVPPATVTVDYPQLLRNDKKTGIPGTPTSVPVLENDDGVEKSSVQLIDPDTNTSVPVLMIPNEGEWRVEEDGNITFIPEPNFRNDPTPVKYVAKDKNGNDIPPATVTVDYPKTAPVAKNDKKSGVPSEPVTIDPFVENGSGVDSDPENDLDKTTVVLTTTNPDATVSGNGKSITVPNEGVWSVSLEGNVTFTPEAGFLSDPTPVNYKVSDKTGLVSNEATLTVDYADVGTIAGTVKIKVGANEVTPLSPVTVTLKDASGAEVATTTTDADGHYEFKNMVVGSYTVVETNPDDTVSVSDKDGESNTFDVIAVTLTTANSLDNNFVEKTETGTLSGIVYKDGNTLNTFDGNDQPLPNVEVIVTDAYGVEHKVSTDDNGAYSVSNIPAGATTIMAVSDDPDLPEGAKSTEHPSPSTVTVVVNTSTTYNMGYSVPTALNIDPVTVATCANPTSITWAGSTKSSKTIWSGETNLTKPLVVTTVGGKTVKATFNIADNSTQFNYAEAGTNDGAGTLSAFPQPYMALYLGNQGNNGSEDLPAGAFATLSVDFNESVILDNWRIRDIDSGDTRGTETGWAWQDAVQMKGYDKAGNEVPLSVVLSDVTNLEKLADGFVQTVNSETGTGTDANASKGHAVWSSNGLPVAKLVLVHKAGSKIKNQTRAAIALSGFAVCRPISISGTIYNDGNGSKDNLVNGTPMGQVEGNPLYAHLVDTAGNVVDAVEVNATTGAYLFNKNIVQNRNYTVQISSVKTAVKMAMPTLTLPTNWSNVSEDAVLDGSRVVAVLTDSVAKVDFGLNKAPENADIVGATVLNPGGTKVAPLSTTPITAELLNSLGIKDLEDGTPATMVIETLPTTGKIYYNNTAIKVGDVIENIDYSKVTIDPNEGNVTVFFNFHMVDEANVSSPSATFSKPFYYVAPKAENDSAVNQNVSSPSNPTNVEVIGSDTKGTYLFDPSTVNLIDPQGNDTKMLIVAGEGIWRVEDNGTITFTPEAGFLSDPTAVTYGVKDTEGNEVKATVTVDYPTVPKDDIAIGIPGTPVSVPVFENDDDVNKSTILLINPDTNLSTPLLEVPNEGVWNVEKDGNITFTPKKDFTGDPTPVKYISKDKNGHDVPPATVTVDYPQTPTDDKKIGIPGEPVTIPVLENDDDVNKSSVRLINPDTNLSTPLLEVPNEGVWKVEDNGSITFTPENNFTDDPTPVKYVTKDRNGNSVPPATVTVNYTKVPKDDSETGTRGDPVVVDVLKNDDKVDPKTVKIVDPNGDPVSELVVPNEGTWTVDPKTGKITFTPNGDFKGDPTPIKYISKDKNGNDVPPATVTVDYPQAPKDDTKIGVPSKPVTVDVLKNDDEVDPKTVKILDPNGVPVTELVVPNEGTWTVDPETGKITFTPNDDFKGDPTPIKYVSKDKHGNDVPEATVTVSYPKVDGILSPDVKKDLPLGERGTVTVFDNDKVDGLNIGTLQIVGTDNPGDPLVVEGEGEWVININNTISFIPEDGFELDPTPITYTVENDAGTKVAPVTVSMYYVPKARSDVKLTNLAEPVTVDILKNDNGDLNVSTVKIVLPEGFMDEHPEAVLSDDNKSLMVPNEGSWKVNPNGTLTYTAEEGSPIVDPTPISYSVQDKSGKVLNADALVTLKQTIVAGESDTNCSNVCDTYEEHNVGLFQNFGSWIMILMGLLFLFVFVRKEEF